MKRKPNRMNPAQISALIRAIFKANRRGVNVLIVWGEETEIVRGTVNPNTIQQATQTCLVLAPDVSGFTEAPVPSLRH